MLAQATTCTADQAFPAVDEVALNRRLTQGRVAQLVARLRSTSLAGALAAGEDPAGSPQLAARAAALGARDTRAAIADQLDGLLQAAEHPRGRWSVRPHRASILANARAMRALAALLRGSASLHPRGVAMLAQLLHDGTGPAYVGGGDGLALRLDEARRAMRP